jgi:hypothetical protein
MTAKQQPDGPPSGCCFSGANQEAGEGEGGGELITTG